MSEEYCAIRRDAWWKFKPLAQMPFSSGKLLMWLVTQSMDDQQAAECYPVPPYLKRPGYVWRAGDVRTNVEEIRRCMGQGGKSGYGPNEKTVVRALEELVEAGCISLIDTSRTYKAHRENRWGYGNFGIHVEVAVQVADPPQEDAVDEDPVPYNGTSAILAN